MARRRYRSDAVSTAGHNEAAPPPAAADESFAQPIEPRAEYGKPDDAAPEPPQHFSTGLGEQLRQQQQHAQNDQLDAYISHYFPGALPHERAALRGNQVWLANPALVHAAGRIALERGIPRQSPEFLRAIGMLIDQHHAAMQAQAAPPPAPPMPPMPPPVTHEHVAPAAEPDEASMDAHYVSAPVSRGEAGHSIDPEPSASSIRLTPAQREIANLPGGPGEVEYAKQFLKMQRAKKSGLLKD